VSRGEDIHSTRSLFAGILNAVNPSRESHTRMNPFVRIRSTVRPLRIPDARWTRCVFCLSIRLLLVLMLSAMCASCATSRETAYEKDQRLLREEEARFHEEKPSPEVSFIGELLSWMLPFL